MRLLLLATLGALGLSQQPPAQPAPQTFRSGAQIIEVDVRVMKDGRFVTDLTAADFEIFEDGVPQKIASVVFVNGTASAPSAPAPSAPSAPLAPSAPQVPPQVWVFVFDTPHLTPGGLTRTREAVVQFIAERFRQGDIGGIVVDGKMMNNRLTSDREELKKAAASVTLTGDVRGRQVELREWPRLRDEFEVFSIVNNDREALQNAVMRACDDDRDRCKGVPPDLQIMAKARDLVRAYRSATLLTLSVVETLSKGLARMPGQKTIVFLSEGFVLQEQEPQLRQAIGQAARAGAHFYSVDARGLNTGANATIIDQPLAGSNIGTAPRFDAHADGTNSLAVDTGGFAIRNENNFGRALDEIQKDAGTYYVIGYTPANTTFDGKYRAIDVKVSRPGVKVRARRGYLALEPAALLRPAPATTAPVPPKAAGDDSKAKANPVTPATPMPAGAPAPDLSLPAASSAARVDVASALASLGKDPAARIRPAGSGETGSASNASAELGWSAYEKGDVETAAKHLTEAAKAPDARPWVHYALGMSQFALRQYRDAAQSWERVRRAVPHFEPVYFSLADAYGLQREDSAAIKVLRDAEQRWPDDAEVANAIGVIQVRRGALDAAIESFERATKIAPGEALGYFNLARAYQMRLLKSQRYDPQTQKWIGGEQDRRRAVEHFKKYIAIGGPYLRQAQEAISALNWS